MTLPFSKPILWAKDKVYALGVWFSTLEDTPAHVSFSEKIDKLHSILNSWSTSHQKIVHEMNSISYDFSAIAKATKLNEQKSLMTTIRAD